MTVPASPPDIPRHAGRALAAYLRNADHWKNVLFVLAGGYATALAVWEAAHRTDLETYILSNQIGAGARPGLLPPLLGAALALALWLALGYARAATGRPDLESWLNRASGVGLSLVLLPFLPVLAIPGLPALRPWLTMGLIALMAAIAALAAHTARRGDPVAGAASTAPEARGVDPGLIVVALLALIYAAYMSALTVARHNAFLTHSFDLGIHDQALYTLLRLGYMRSTQYGIEAINYIGDHFSPIFYLIAPVYALYQDSRMLLILQSVALGIGAIPVYLLARRLTGSRLLALALGAGYLLYPALHGANTFDFHQIVLATPLLLFGLYFLESGRDRAFLIALFLAMLVKEEVALTVAAIGLYLFAGKRRYRLGALLMGVGAVYFVAVTRFVMPALGGEPQVNRFAAMMPPGEEGLTGVAKTLLTNPFYTLTLIFSEPDRLIYLAQIFLSLLFLPLLGGSAWLAALPAVAVSLLTDAETQFSIRYHYPAIFIPFAFYLAAMGARAFLSLRRAGRENHPVFSATGLAAGLLVAGLAMNYSYGWLFSRQFYDMTLRRQHASQVRECIAGIPREASVSAMSDLVPHLSGRNDIYLFPIVNGADYIVFDADPGSNFWPFIEQDGRLDAIRQLAPYIVSGEYGLAHTQDGCMVLRRGADPSSNGAAVRELLSARYEAEDLRSNFPDSIVDDPAASEGRARRAASAAPYPDTGNALTYGPYNPLFPGRYRVDYALRQEGETDAEGPVVTVDIFSNSAGGALAGEEVSAGDVLAEETYIEFPVQMEIREPWGDLEYRVLYHGPGALRADKISVSPLVVFMPIASTEAEESTDGAFPVVSDEAAREGKALEANPAQPAGVMLDESVGNLLPGSYRADFILKASPGDPEALIAVLEVLAAGNVIGARELQGADFSTPGEYQPLSLEFGSDQILPDVRLRLNYAGDQALRADAVELLYLYQEPG